MRVNDLTGQKFGRLTAITRAENGGKYHKVRWLCRCECGNSVIVFADNLRNGASSKCNSPENNHPLYRVYRAMLDRCLNPNIKDFMDYGGRGIRVSEHWLGHGGFKNFIADVGERPPSPEDWTSRVAYYSLDRIDPNGNYEPGNCRWATPTEQRANRR